ncbi:hypothetical protein WOLCODRAFT_166545 [Wolfiporia cocos MD-104 SS10]|uniref:Uncharacterized protein n=1 Tax=Wolfiporia cocos (strain MD-104) TaxID=742152 RepID=A0A2H3J814_WOLCO|nr:hypothetical protein WOLCODRAFT_166545 [Wolfiporia cocos MD-104 SS10]
MDATATAVSVQPTAPAPAALTEGPVPMSFPAILRTPGLSDRFAHLLPALGDRVAVPAVPKRNRRNDKEGKRRVRRKENAQFVGNAQVVHSTERDYAPRSILIPPAAPPTREPSSAAVGRFSLSLKGMRRMLRRVPRRSCDVESVLLAWFADDVLLAPDDAAPLAFPGAPLGETGVVVEMQRGPLGPVPRLRATLCTACTRFHGVDDPPHRLMNLLYPNVTRPTRAPAMPRAPRPARARNPATGLSEYYSPDVASDSGSERDPDETLRLVAIVEASAPRASRLLSDDEWPVIDVDA